MYLPKIIERGVQDFLVKMGKWGGGEVGGGEREGKHSLSLIKYGFCRSNAIYSASLSFSMFVFLLTPFDT